MMDPRKGESRAMNLPNQSLQGQLLLDSGMIGESIFHRSVVFICHHDDQGAVGLVINRSTKKRIEFFAKKNLPESLRNHILYLGGPLDPHSIKYLYSDPLSPDDQGSLKSNLQLGHSIEDLIRISGTSSPSRKMRMYAGHASWSPGQLDNELAAGAWITHPASLDLIFSPDPDKLWKSIVREKDWQGLLLSLAPDDLSHN